MKYQIIYADPPWKYDFCRKIKTRPNNMHIVETHYPTMTAEEIKNISLGNIIDKNCVLFLWATSPKLKEAIEIIEPWGFNYVTSMIWDKDWRGMGYWTRSQHEILLIARRGKVKPPRLSISSIIKSKKGRHSKKPTIFYEIIEEMFPDSNKIELFAREKREGWDVWGNEVESDIELKGQELI